MDLDVLLENSLRDWVIAAGTTAGVLALLWLASGILLRITEHRRAPLGASTVQAFLAALQRRTKGLVLLVIAVFAGSQALTLPGGLHEALRLALVFALLGQVGFWGVTAIRFWTAWYQGRMPGERAVAGALEAASYIASVALWSLILVLALDNMGIQVTALIAGLGIGGIAIALAAQGVLKDLFASLAIILDRPFAVGDFVIVGDLMGAVERVGIKTTRIRSLSGEQLVFANSDLLDSRIRNYGLLRERRVVFSFGVTYDTPAEQLRRIPEYVRRAVEAQPQTRFDRAHFNAYGESALNFEVVYHVLSADYNVYMDIQQAINLEVLERLTEEGVAFAFPTRTLHIYGEAMPLAR